MAASTVVVLVAGLFAALVFLLPDPSATGPREIRDVDVESDVILLTALGADDPFGTPLRPVRPRVEVAAVTAPVVDRRRGSARSGSTGSGTGTDTGSGPDTNTGGGTTGPSTSTPTPPVTTAPEPTPPVTTDPVAPQPIAPAPPQVQVGPIGGTSVVIDDAGTSVAVDSPVDANVAVGSGQASIQTPLIDMTVGGDGGISIG